MNEATYKKIRVAITIEVEVDEALLDEIELDGIGDMLEDAITIDPFVGYDKSDASGDRAPVFRNVHFANVDARVSK